MTPYLASQHPVRLIARVGSFSDDREIPTAAPVPSKGCLVRVTHASVGSTDVMARRGDYLLHPFTGFVSGYDFVGVLERVDRAGRERALTPGQRIAGILPNMGAHATLLGVPASLLVPVPDALPSEIAATLPLDAVTAQHAINLLKPGSRKLFIQGISGAVGILATQLARRGGLSVIGTASSTSAPVAERYGAAVVDYHDEDWPEQVLERVGRVDGAIDHTGSGVIGNVVMQDGRIVRTAFGGRIGHQKAATFVGFARTLARRYAHPSEAICSVPMYVAMRRSGYRRVLSVAFDLAAGGELTPLEPVVHPFDDLSGALEAAAHTTPGHKIIVEMTP